jgi:hypothetical protein
MTAASTSRVLAPFHLAILAVAFAGLAKAQAPADVAAAERARATAVKLELLHDLPWNGRTQPMPSLSTNERLTPLVFTGDGAWLALGGDAFLDVASGATTMLPERASMIGPLAGDRFLLRANAGFVRANAAGQRDPIPFQMPYDIEYQGSPAGSFVLLHGNSYSPHAGNPRLLELATLREFPLPIRDRSVTAIAWSPDGQQLALALAIGIEKADQIGVFDTRGRLLQRVHPDRQEPITALAFDVDGKSLLWSGRLLHRVEVATGRPLAWGENPQRWLMPITKDLVLGHDGRQLTWFTARNLLAVQQLDLGCGSDKGGVRGCVLSPARDRLAVAGPDSLRIYRIKR